jgi:hypothetical protein
MLDADFPAGAVPSDRHLSKYPSQSDAAILTLPRTRVARSFPAKISRLIVRGETLALVAHSSTVRSSARNASVSNDADHLVSQWNENWRLILQNQNITV